MKRDANKPGPLESYKMAAHCEMCGANSLDGRHRALVPRALNLEAAFNPSGQPMTLCFDCRIGSAEILADVRADLLAACKLALKVTPALSYEPGTAQRKAHDALVAAIAKATKR
jgi:hypothetical protein